MTINYRQKVAGQSLIEILAGMLVFIPVALVFVDAITLAIGVSFNNSVCREAARAAASGPPNGIKPGEPLRRATTVVRRTYQTQGAVRLSPLVACVENIRSALPTAPFGGPVDGEVTVSTSVDIRPPFVNNIVPQGYMRFTTRQTFPYTWVMPSNTGG